jgi:hypothetical protein
VFTALSLAVLWLTTFSHSSKAATRGLALEIKASEAPNAPTVETVNLYTRSFALVIGNNDYGRGWQRLSKAVSDARRVAKALEKHGFDVTLRTDLKSDDLATTLKNFFIDRGRDPHARLFVWFAGHGATVDGEGYLIPADGAALTDETGFLHKALSLRRFGEYVRLAKSKHVFSVFDACFAGTIFNVARSKTPPAITRVTTEPVRQFLSSGDAGQEVSDNGEFASMFIEALEGRSRADANADGYLTGTEIGENLTYRMANVTNNRQTPRSGKLRSVKFDRGDFVFRLGRGVSIPSAPPVDRDALFWLSIKDSSDAADYQAYLDQYPIGGFAALARNKLKRLSAKVATVAAVPKARKSGETYKDCDNCPVMVVLDIFSKRNETHKVPVAVGKYEITFDQWEACLSDGGCNNYMPFDQNWGRGQRPVINVNWNHAQSYLRWLSVKTKRTYRLPTVYEWENFGAVKYSVTNVGQEGLPNLDGDKTNEVGKSGGNSFGLSDTIGNVSEWTSDCAVRQSRDAQGKLEINGGCLAKFIKGGSWKDSEWQLQLKNQYNEYILLKYPNIGFRVLADVD